MTRLLQIVLLFVSVLGTAAASSAGQLFAFNGAGWRSFVVLDDALVNRLSEHDLTLLRLALQRQLFREISPLSRETQQPAAIVVLQPSDQPELDQLVQRLGALIRDAERQGERR